MPGLLPSPFRAREWILTVMALTVWLFSTAPGIGAQLETGKTYSDDTPFMKQLQASFFEFKLLKPNDDPDHPKFQKLKLENPITVHGKDYYAFRFAVPQRTGHEDMVLAYIAPKGALEYGFEISKSEETNSPSNLLEFENVLYFPRKKYPALRELVPASGRFITLQRIPGTMLADRNEYFVWFGFKSGANPKWMSLEFKFVVWPAKGPHVRETYEKALGLQRGGADPNSAEE